MSEQTVEHSCIVERVERVPPTQFGGDSTYEVEVSDREHRSWTLHLNRPLTVGESYYLSVTVSGPQ